MKGRSLPFCGALLLASILFYPSGHTWAAEPSADADTGSPAAETEATPLAFAVEGLWYVLIHYTDDHAGDPTGWHWEDHLWVIEQEGKSLRWRDYSIVVFEDAEGRFERVGNNPLSRTTGAWEPNAAQREQIRGGLQVNERGLRSERLQAAEEGEAPAKGAGRLLWSSAAPAPAFSASVITFSSTWQIVQEGELPVFSWDDLLSSARTESMEGRTEFRVESVDAEGVAQGRFERDGVRHGRFRLYRTAAPGDVDSKKRGLFR